MEENLRDRLRSVEESVVKKFYFRFTHYGWATIVIDDAHGDLLINSDWGKWSHTWGGGPKHWGTPTFTDFLCGTNPWYIAEKLGYGIETMETDVDAMAIEMKKSIIRSRIEGFAIPFNSLYMPSQKEVARELWDETMEFIQALREDEGHARYCCVTEAMNKEFEDLSEWFVYRPQPSFTFLREQLLPVFLSYLRGELDDKQQG